MRRNLRTASAYKLTLITAAVLAFIFCAGVISYAQTVTVSGIVTRGGVPCPDARVILTDNAMLTPTYTSVITDSNGYYSFTGLTLDGSYKISFNAIKAVPQVDLTVDASVEQVTMNVDLAYGYTPVYDDFSGTEVSLYNEITNPNDYKWKYFNAGFAVPDLTSGDWTETTATIDNGVLKISPFPGRGGIVSKDPFPKFASYEYVWPTHYEGVIGGSNQSFCIINDLDSGYSKIIDLQDQYSSPTTNWRINLFVEGTKAYNPGTGDAYSSLYGITILRSGTFFDLFVNGSRRWGGENTNFTDDSYIYLYGFENTVNVTTSTSYYTNPTTAAFFDSIRAGATVPVTLNTVAEARAAATDTYITINDVIVTASFADAFWVESADRSAGIKVISTANPSVGRKAIIYGKIVRENNEVALQAMEITRAGTFSVPAVGITGKIASEFDKAGAAAQGLLVKVAGKVTEVVTDTGNTKIIGLYLDDGSGITTGTHRGLYIKIEESWNVPLGAVAVDDFITREGPLTVFMADGTTPVPTVRALKAIDYVPTFTAYNDVLLDSGDPNYNITTYSRTTPFAQSGYLMDYATGKYIAERVALTCYNVSTSQYGCGSNPPETTDVGTYFIDWDATPARWIVSFKGCLYPEYTPYSGWYVDLTFSGLDPNARYEFIGSANRNEAFTNLVRYTILDYADRTYACSAGATMESEDAVRFNASNNSAGYVARWINIKPSANGTFRIRSNGRYSTTKTYPYGAFRLRKQAGVETP